MFHEWEASVGFIGLILLGSVGFLDPWTVTVSRFSHAAVIEDVDALDRRCGLVLPADHASAIAWRNASSSSSDRPSTLISS